MALNPPADRTRVIARKDYYPSERLRKAFSSAGKKNKEFLTWRKIWKFIRPVLRWGTGLSFGAAIILGTGAALVIAHHRITTSDYFALKEIHVEGNSYLLTTDLVEQLGLKPGQNILALSIRNMEQNLEHNPWVRAWSIRRDAAKGILHIWLREAQPCYWIREKEGRLYYADERGQSIALVEAENCAFLPLLETEPEAETFLNRLPDLVSAFTSLNFPLNISTAKQIRLTEAKTMEITTKENRRLIIGIDNWESNLLHLCRVIEDLSRTGELKHMLEIRAYGKDIWVRLNDAPRRLTMGRQPA